MNISKEVFIFGMNVSMNISVLKDELQPLSCAGSSD